MSLVFTPGGPTIDGWTQDVVNTWTRTANTTFTTSGDTTAQFGKGTRIKVTDTTTKYFVVVSSSFAAGTTTVTITGGTDYSLAANPTAQYYSYQASPQGYPPFFNASPSVSGFSGSPTVACVFSVVGALVSITLYVSGTSNATTFTITLPITSTTVGGGIDQMAGSVRITDNGTLQAASGWWDVAANSATLNVYRTGAFSTWTASGTKTAQGQFTYYM